MSRDRDVSFECQTDQELEACWDLYATKTVWLPLSWIYPEFKAEQQMVETVERSTKRGLGKLRSCGGVSGRGNSSSSLFRQVTAVQKPNGNRQVRHISRAFTTTAVTGRLARHSEWSWRLPDDMESEDGGGMTGIEYI
jgi:hypothetical protein